MFTQEKAIVAENGQHHATDTVCADDRVQVLNHCDTFGILDRWGDILPAGKGIHGLYYKDTRFISALQMRVNGYKPILLSSVIEEENEILSVDLTNPEMTIENGDTIPHGIIHIRRTQFVSNHIFRENVVLENFSTTSRTMNLSFRFAGDFSDIFEVRGTRRVKKGTFLGYEYRDNQKIWLHYRGLDDITRSCEVAFSHPYSFEQDETGIIFYSLLLPPKHPFTLSYTISFFITPNQTTSLSGNGHAAGSPKIKLNFPIIETDNEQFTHWINRSRIDLSSLLADTEFGKFPYAGVPWYNTAFGRDGIITALETLWICPSLSRSVLLFLTANQATSLDRSSDAEPGKILHETRGGEMVNLNEVPFKKYYGSIDSTPLFVVLAGEYAERTGDFETIRNTWHAIEAAIDWIDRYGDLDGDGFVEYQHKAANGLTNQGWKDSGDSVFYENGLLAEPPIALCEVQGYVYMAKLKAANLALRLGYHHLATRWKEEAKQLKIKFNARFWDEELGCYVIALDGNKQPCRVKTSNTGHVLFTGIATKNKAKKIAKALLAPDMFSGWGVRTLSTNAANYNPMSYHNGSVWPHDVALIALGFSHYGMKDEVLRLVTGLFDASLFINLQRLPELFCGFERRKGEGPTAYPVACSPQAWSVAAVFILLRSLLRIQVLPMRKKIIFRRPVMPGYLRSIRIKALPLETADKTVDLEISRYDNESMIGVNYRNLPKDWKLVIIK